MRKHEAGERSSDWTRRELLRGAGRLAAFGGGLALLTACGAAASNTSAASATASVSINTASSAAAPSTAGGATTASTSAASSAASTATPSAAAPKAPAPTPTVAPAANGLIGPQSAKTKLTMWQIQGGGPSLQSLVDLVTSYTKQHPDLSFKLSFVPGSSTTGPYVEKITAAVASGTPPDIFQMNRPSQFGAVGALTDMAPYIAKDKTFNEADFFPAPWSRNTWQGKVYGVPVICDSRGYWMNTKLFQQAGMDPAKPPTSQDDLLHVIDALSVKDGSNGYKRFGFIPLYGNSDFYAYLYRNGGQLYDKNYKVTFNQDAGVNALDWLVKGTDATGGAQMVNSYEQSFSSGANDPFIAGLVASKIDGVWNLATLQQYAPNLEFALAPEPIPSGGHKATMIGGYNWSIAQASKHVQDSYDFLAWLTMPTQAVAFAEATGNMPARKSALDSTYVQKNPNVKFFYDALAYGVPYETGPWTQVMWDAVNVTATQDAIYHRKSPKDALDAAAQTVQAEINKWLAKK